MKIKGSVISGTGEGAYYVSQDVYMSQFENKVGFKPFPGTLNIRVNENEVGKIQEMVKGDVGILDGSGNFGDVKFIKAILNYKIEGALIFPLKTHHPTEIIEFIAPINLRKKLNLKDSDVVIIEIKG